MVIRKTVFEAAEKIGVYIPEIYLPNQNVEMKKWSVVACDQYTSQPEYWKGIENEVGDAPSTLHIVFPEIYLEESDAEQRVLKINSTMQRYVEEGVVKPYGPGFVYVERDIFGGRVRKGLIMALDLEKYDFNIGSQSLIRATEGTVIDRLPPRVKIRENALMETPHIMVLIDDHDMKVIEPLSESKKNFEKIYDFNLIPSNHSIRGYMIDDDLSIMEVVNSLYQLANEAIVKYGTGILFAVGDGNHSLAAAKKHWENLKKQLSPEQLDHHPSRYALVEVINIHDSSLLFEPIHRLVTNISPEDILSQMVEYFNSNDIATGAKIAEQKEKEPIRDVVYLGNTHDIPFTSEDKNGVVEIINPHNMLEAASLQAFLDYYCDKNKHARVDYIHGDETLARLGSEPGNIGFYLPALDKNSLFKTIIKDGVLPKKTFSLGEADEKRYYLECRKIKP